MSSITLCIFERGCKISKKIRIKNETSTDYLTNKVSSSKFCKYFSMVLKVKSDHVLKFQSRFKIILERDLNSGS